MQGKRLAKMGSLAFFLPLLTLGCDRQPEVKPDVRITQQDVSEVLVAAANAMAKYRRFNNGYCISTALDESVTIVKPEDPDSYYQVLASPKLGALPPDAIAAFPAKMIEPGCRHTLVLNEPQFVRIKRPPAFELIGAVEISDRCPTCGSGYRVQVKKQGTKWIAEPPGVVLTWIS